jgi:hypothetical protein
MHLRRVGESRFLQQLAVYGVEHSWCASMSTGLLVTLQGFKNQIREED